MIMRFLDWIAEKNREFLRKEKEEEIRNYPYLHFTTHPDEPSEAAEYIKACEYKEIERIKQCK